MPENLLQSPSVSHLALANVRKNGTNFAGIHEGSARFENSRGIDRSRLVRIRQLQFALKRLQDQEFGYCVSCGEFIGIARLDIDPAALWCVACAK